MRVSLLVLSMFPAVASAADVVDRSAPAAEVRAGVSAERRIVADDVDHVPAEFATIQEAVDNGTAPVIRVAAGEWTGARVTRSVEIEGESGAIIGAGPAILRDQAGFVLDASGSKSTIRGFTFDCANTEISFGVFSSVRRFGSAADAVTVQNNTFQGCVQGVTNTGSTVDECRPESVDGGSYWVVENNTFDGIRTRTKKGYDGGGMGIYVFNAEGADILGNTFTGAVQDTKKFTTGGVVIAGCWDCTIAQNKFGVTGATAYYAAISNFGYYESGAAASRHLVVADNEAYGDSAPHFDVNYRSYDSFDTSFDENSGVTFIDHTFCGDEKLDTFETPSKPASKAR